MYEIIKFWYNDASNTTWFENKELLKKSVFKKIISEPLVYSIHP